MKSTNLYVDDISTIWLEWSQMLEIIFIEQVAEEQKFTCCP